MEVEKVLHMKAGLGGCSYAHNSLLQRMVFVNARQIREESIKELCCTILPEDSLIMADLGCSSGPNSLLMVSEAIDIINGTCRNLRRSAPKLKVFLNDLIGNDFNAIFKLLPDFYKRLEEEKGSDIGQCLISATPGSFYGKLFPNNFLHFVHSSYSIHFLSKVPNGLVNKKNGKPLNKGNIYIAKTSPPEVWKAYYAQFKSDFTLFLRSRSKEIRCGGRMMLTFIGSIKGDDPDSVYEYIGIILNNMALEGLIDNRKLDMFNLPYYTPTAEEVRMLIDEEGLFSVNKLETFTVDWDAGCPGGSGMKLDSRAKFVADTMRAVAEPILASEFGEAIMDELFLRFKDLVMGLSATKKMKHFNIVVSMTRK
ncbi:hypothetical protein Ancab_017733 [Ancistrocladus abbreviatus]